MLQRLFAIHEYHEIKYVVKIQEEVIGCLEGITRFIDDQIWDEDCEFLTKLDERLSFWNSCNVCDFSFGGSYKALSLPQLNAETKDLVKLIATTICQTGGYMSVNHCVQELIETLEKIPTQVEDSRLQIRLENLEKDSSTKGRYVEKMYVISGATSSFGYKGLLNFVLNLFSY